MKDRILVQSLTNFFEVNYGKVDVRQFKDTRTEDRKISTQKRTIEYFERGLIRGCGIIGWNSQRIALSNAMKFAVDAGYSIPKCIKL